jgi:hypothetical protein
MIISRDIVSFAGDFPVEGRDGGAF